MSIEQALVWNAGTWALMVIGFGVERRNLGTDGNRKGTSHRKARPKVEMQCTGAEMLVVVMKFL